MFSPRVKAKAAIPEAIAWIACLIWLASRLGLPPLSHGTEAAVGLDVGGGNTLPYLFLHGGWLWLVPAIAVWTRWAPSRFHIGAVLALLTSAVAVGALARSLGRYWAGYATAWDLANFAQPMWRLMEGGGLTSSWHGGLPLWGDHGSYIFYLFAPLTRMGDPAVGLLVAQALLVAALVPMVYGLARALDLTPGLALMLACVAAASRPLENAVGFDFHPECALPVALIGLVWAHRTGRTIPLLGFTAWLVATKDVAALTAAGGLLYLAWRGRGARSLTLGLAVVVAIAVAAIDILGLPRWTGWPSYLGLNTSAPVDGALAAQTTAFRALSTGLFPWAHPFAWLAGAPWMAAAALSPKLIVKGVGLQYSFIFVPVALAGAALTLQWAAGRWPRAVGSLAAVWVLATIAINGPAPSGIGTLSMARARHEAVTEIIHQGGGLSSDLTVAADNCTAPYVMARSELMPVCYLDFARLAKTGEERMDIPVARALEADAIVVRRDCPFHGGCVEAQRQQALSRGYRVTAEVGPLVVMRRPAADGAR